MAQIPERLINFRCYTGAAMNEALGITDVELPSFEGMTEKIMGAGIAGEIDSVVLGHYGSQVLKLKWRVAPKAIWSLNDQTILQSIAVYGAVQTQEPVSGALSAIQIRVEVRGQTKTFKPGKMEPGKPMDAEVEIECAAIRVLINGEEMIAIDKLNFICRVNGKDILAAVRVAMGGV